MRKQKKIREADRKVHSPSNSIREREETWKEGRTNHMTRGHLLGLRREVSRGGGESTQCPTH